jgi:hypothetical protein
MLYMVVNTHAAESCAFRGEEEARHLETAFDRFTELAGDNGFEVRGSWINRPAHEAFLLVDAPDAHAIDELLVSAGLVGRTSTRVLSVVAIDDAVTPYTETVLGAGASS